MPRDQRLYTTFPIDFHRHPKLRRLPVEVRWTFVEMNGEARIADNDGIFDEADAEFLWPKDHLDALVASHPLRPLVQHFNGTYIIRDYAEHQETREIREARAEKNRANGAKGGRPPKNPVGTEPKPSGLRLGSDSLANRTQRNPESESESESEDSTKTSQSQSLDNRANVSTDAEKVSDMTKRLAAQAGVSNLTAIVEQVAKHTGRTITHGFAYQLATHIIGKAKSHPRNPQMYVARSIALSPFEIQQFIDTGGTA